MLQDREVEAVEGKQWVNNTELPNFQQLDMCRDMGLNLGIMLAVSAGEQSLTPLAIRQVPISMFLFHHAYACHSALP